jgi:hypothetical protein
MDRFESRIDIDASAQDCYSRWQNLESFPHFMTNVKEVKRLDANRWHWIVMTPLGNEIAWACEVDSDARNNAIAWHTTSDSDINMQGAVRFDEIAPHHTHMTCFIQYEFPQSGLKEAIAHFSHQPQKMVEEELKNFKHLVEKTHIPAEKAHVGKVLTPDPSVIPTALGAAGGMAAGRLQDIEDHSYQGPFGLEDELPPVGTSTEVADADTEELIMLANEENPYLGTEGALYSEDLIDMRADSNDEEEVDVFTESMDVENEDLESFTEDLDEDIDIGMGMDGRESYESKRDIGKLSSG